jgi:hypothetical protein
VISGYCSASKESALRRCLSLWHARVDRVDGDLYPNPSGLVSGRVVTHRATHALERPFTLVTIKYRTPNATVVWVRSIVQSVLPVRSIEEDPSVGFCRAILWALTANELHDLLQSAPGLQRARSYATLTA